MASLLDGAIATIAGNVGDAVVVEIPDARDRPASRMRAEIDTR